MLKAEVYSAFSTKAADDEWKYYIEVGTQPVWRFLIALAYGKYNMFWYHSSIFPIAKLIDGWGVRLHRLKCNDDCADGWVFNEGESPKDINDLSRGTPTRMCAYMPITSSRDCMAYELSVKDYQRLHRIEIDKDTYHLVSAYATANDASQVQDQE